MAANVVLSLVNDLFFSERIETALTNAGYRVSGATEQNLAEVVADSAPVLVIVDIGGFGLDWEAAIRTLKTLDASLPILAFGSHMDVAARNRAVAAGAERVVAKSQFVENMVALVGRYARGAGSEATP